MTDTWLESRMESVPDEFRPWLDGASEPAGNMASRDEGAPASGTDATSLATQLEARGLDSLRKAMAAPGRIRSSAFHLLAADAWLTWSAEALLDHPDPPGALAALLRRVASEGE